LSLVIGFGAGLLKIEPLSSGMAFLLPFTLFVFPSLLEEAFFRGVLIPRDSLQSGGGKAVRAVVISTLAFVLWHPLNAMAFNPTAIDLFLNPWFLLIVTALGLTCGYSYVVSRSLWVPLLIHWATVSLWVLLLGGRNLVLEL
jgi:predicted Abi (CAAX) family protease